MQMTAQRIFAWLWIAGLLTGCGSGSSAGPDCRFNEAWENGQCSAEIPDSAIFLPDGIWRGADSSNRPVTALVNRFGAFQFIDGDGNQGTGTLAVGAGKSVAGSFQLVPQIGRTFADGSTQADCTLSGTLFPRERLALVQDCATSAGFAFQENLSLDFDAVYMRTASLAMIAGAYETPTGSTLSITSAGDIFAQDAASGCVTNGQVQMTVSFTNMYLISYNIDNCAGAEAIWNGASFSGLAYLDNTFAPEILEFAVIGEVGGLPVSVVRSIDRI